MAPAQGRGPELLGGGAGGGIGRVPDHLSAHPQRLGNQPGQLRMPLCAGEFQQVAAVDRQHVEEDRGQRQRGLRGGDVHP